MRLFGALRFGVCAPEVNWATQPDLLFSETSCSFSLLPPRAGRRCVGPRKLAGRNWPAETGRPKLALYSLTDRGRFPFHAEPTQAAAWPTNLHRIEII